MLAALLLAPLLVFHGNVALLEDVYRSVLDLNGSTKATPAAARMVAVRLASFLHRAGNALPTVSATAPRIQLDEINPLEKMSFGLVRPGRPYELHILVQPGKFRPGISPELEIDSVEGGAIGATYHSGRLLFQDDRWELGGRVAGAVRHELDGGASSFAFTRALGEVRYDAPSITGVLRPSLRARGELTNRQRPDLRLESFMFTTLEGGVDLVL